MTLSDARQHRRPSRRWGRKPRAERASPDDPHHPSSVPCPLPRRIETGARVGSFPVPRGLPRISGGSASATSLSRPAQASLALRPAGSLNRPRRPLSQGFDRAGYPAGPLASYQTKPTTLWVEPSSTGDARRLGARRVEEGRDDCSRQLRLPSPLIKPDVRVSRIRLSDWLHRRAHGGGPKWTRRRWSTPSAPNTVSRGKRLVPCEGTL